MSRIITDPKILAGKLTIAGTRIPASLVLHRLRHGYEPDRIIAAYPILAVEAIDTAVAYASALPSPGGKAARNARTSETSP